jgi:acylphosphatase
MTDSGEELERIRLRIVGRVQGVGYRYFVRLRARSLELRGWVRNEDDGSVVVEAEGLRESLDALVRSAAKGPRGARVDSVRPEPVAGGREPMGPFEVRYFD